MQCKNSMVVKGGRMARKERGREGRGESQQYSSPSALFSHYCLFSLKFLWLLVKMPTWFSVSVGKTPGTDGRLGAEDRRSRRLEGRMDG